MEELVNFIDHREASRILEGRWEVQKGQLKVARRERSDTESLVGHII